MRIRVVNSRLLVMAAWLSLGSAQVQAQDAGAPAVRPWDPSSTRVSRLGAINVPYENYAWFVEHGYDLIARVGGGPEGSEAQVHEQLKAAGIEHFTYGRGDVKASELGAARVPSERQILKRGPGANKYVNRDAVCGGWDERFRFRGEHTAAKMKDALEDGIIFEDFLNRALCYCPACEAEFRADTGRSGFPELVYNTPHYEDTTAFDPTFIAWDQQRLAEHLQLLAEPIHRAGKNVMVSGVCRWIVGPEALKAVDGAMFYTYYAGRRLPPNYMRNWKYWHDHLIPKDLWVIFGYFREYHTCHTRVMLANLPDGVNLAFWACGRQWSDASSREDALYACDVVRSHLVPIRVAVYDSAATQGYWAREEQAWRETHVDKAVLGLERLGLDAEAITSLDGLDRFELLYLEDVECLSRGELDQIRQSGVLVLASGLTGLRDGTGKLWKDLDKRLAGPRKDDPVLNLPSPIALGSDHLNIEVESLRLEHPWFEFMFDRVSPRRGDMSMARPYTDPSHYSGVRQYALSLIPSRVYGEFLDYATISRYDGVPLGASSETQRPMIVYDEQARQVYSTVRFSDYVNVHDVTECGYGYQMRQFCFLQMIDALTLGRRGVRVEPYMTTAVRSTDTGHFLTIGNVHDEPRAVTLTLDRTPKAVYLNHVRLEGRLDRKLALPPIGAKDAVQVHVSY